MNIDIKAKELSEYFRIIKETSHGIDKNNPSVCDLVNFQEAQILLRLGCQGACTAGTFAQNLQLSLGGVSSVINKLEKKKLIQRKHSRQDRRVVYVTLTQKGRRLYNLIQEAHLKLTRNILSALNLKEQNLLLQLFRKISNTLQKEIPVKTEKQQKTRSMP